MGKKWKSKIILNDILSIYSNVEKFMLKQKKTDLIIDLCR